MRTILFDVDGVLVHGYHVKPELRKCWDESMEEDFGISRARFRDEFIRTCFAKEVLTGERDLHNALTEHLPKLGYEGDVQKFIMYWLEKDANLNHDLIDAIKKLKASGKARLVIATNQENNRAKYLMETMGLNELFEDILNSARLGARKPSKQFYENAEKLLNLSEAEKPILFDDTPEVVEGAKNHGWEAVEYISVQDLDKHPYVKEILDQYR